MLTALTVGTFLPSPFAGTVYSVHDHAINISDEDNYRLISIVGRRSDMTALSVLVPHLPEGAAPGQAVTISGDRLSLSDAPARFGAIISLRTLRSPTFFSGSISESRTDTTTIAVCKMLPLIREAVLAHGSPAGLRDLVGASLLGHVSGGPPPSVSPFVARALDATFPTDSEVPSIDLSQLVGLGVGFTPSGDDFVMGFLAAVAATGTIHPDVGEANLESVRGRLGGTTLGGATLLRLALDGSFPAYICEFVDKMRLVNEIHVETTPVAASVSRAVIRAVGHGESSGTDALAGFTWALSRICGTLNLTNHGRPSIVRP